MRDELSGIPRLLDRLKEIIPLLLTGTLDEIQEVQHELRETGFPAAGKVGFETAMAGDEIDTVNCFSYKALTI